MVSVDFLLAEQEFAVILDVSDDTPLILRRVLRRRLWLSVDKAGSAIDGFDMVSVDARGRPEDHVWVQLGLQGREAGVV